jgi:hypothetical protein
VQSRYLDQAYFQTYLKHRYYRVQKANEYMQAEQPWTKLKDPTTRDN